MSRDSFQSFFHLAWTKSRRSTKTWPLSCSRMRVHNLPCRCLDVQTCEANFHVIRNTYVEILVAVVQKRGDKKATLSGAETSPVWHAHVSPQKHGEEKHKTTVDCSTHWNHLPIPVNSNHVPTVHILQQTQPWDYDSSISWKHSTQLFRSAILGSAPSVRPVLSVRWWHRDFLSWGAPTAGKFPTKSL